MNQIQSLQGLQAAQAAAAAAAQQQNVIVQPAPNIASVAPNPISSNVSSALVHTVPAPASIQVCLFITSI